MKTALEETSRRRALQEAYNREHGITPESIKKNIGELLSSIYEADYAAIPEVAETPEERYRSLDELEREVKALEKQMREAAKALEFEKAAEIRDRVKALRASPPPRGWRRSRCGAARREAGSGSSCSSGPWGPPSISSPNTSTIPGAGGRRPAAKSPPTRCAGPRPTRSAST